MSKPWYSLRSKEQMIIEDVLSLFDFNRVYKTMVALEWVWHFGDGRYGIPDEETIRQSATDRMIQAFKTGHSSTGGFTAAWDGKTMSLSFCVADVRVGDGEF